MLNRKTETKIKTILHNWTMGNRKDAAKIVRNLSKLEICQLFTRRHEALPDFIMMSAAKRVDFESFIENALEGLFN